MLILALAAFVGDLLLDEPPRLRRRPALVRTISAPCAVDGDARQSAPMVIARRDGARVFWIEDVAGEIRFADVNGNCTVRRRGVIGWGTTYRAVAVDEERTLVAWIGDGSPLTATIFDAEGHISASFPVTVAPGAAVTGAACTADDCAIAWSFEPRSRITFENAGFVQRFTKSGTPLTPPVATPAGTHQPQLVGGSRDYLVLLRSYDYGRSVDSYARLVDGEVLDESPLAGRSLAASAGFDGERWLIATHPMGPYSLVDMEATLVGEAGTPAASRSFYFAHDFHNGPRAVAWDGQRWIVALAGQRDIFAVELSPNARGASPRFAVTTSEDAEDDVSISSHGDGVTWLAYVVTPCEGVCESGARVFVRRVEVRARDM